MAQQTKTILKNYFITGTIINESMMVNLIDSLSSKLVAGTNITLIENPNGTITINKK